jgi:hypothetical protein
MKQPFTIGGSTPLKKAIAEESGITLAKDALEYAFLEANAYINILHGSDFGNNSTHYILPQDWDKAVAAIKDFFAEEKFEKGKWCYAKVCESEYLLRFSHIAFELIYCDEQIFMENGRIEYSSERKRICNTNSLVADCMKPATEEQIQFMLGKVAESKGYVEGAKVKKGTVTQELSLMRYAYLDTEDILYCGSISIYQKGKWAELLPQEEAKPQTLVLKGVKMIQEIDEFTASEKTVDLELTATHLQQLKAYFTA